LRAGKKIYFGWWTVLVTGVLSGLGHGFYGYGFSVFFKDLAAELGLSRAVTSLAAGIGRPAGGITSPVVGLLADRYGPKYIIFFGVCLAASGLILMNFIATTTQYILVWGIMIGMGLNIGLTVAVDKSLNDWFVLKRGLAQGTKFGLLGVGGLAALPVVALLVTHLGWRMTCLVWGLLLFGLSPLILIFVRQKRPEHYGLLPDGAEAPPPNDSGSDQPEAARIVDFQNEETDFSFRQAVRTRAYWLLAAAFAVQMLIMGGVGIHVIPFLTDIGIDRAHAAGMMGLLVFFTIPSQFFSGIVADRVGKRRLNLLLVGVYLLQGAGLLALLVGGSGTAPVYVFLMLYGFTSGAATPLFILILGRYFGRQAFGAIFGGSMIIRAPASFLAPVLSGWIYDRTGSYMLAFAIYTALALAAAVIMFFVRPVAPPEAAPTE